MKRYTLIILAAVLSMLGIQTASAQQTQDALYIFRNDGQFNAFFFGDIDRIEYSKIDTLGVEQDDYVVQEVYALDTLFRIPLNAIDSIAFVTPETKYKADVFRPDKSIANYIVASDTINWIRLASSTPAAMIPKVGDKLLIEEESKYIPNGFVGLVTSVVNGNNGYTVMTGDLAVTDVYERLVVKAAGATPLPGNARHRGLFDGTEMSYTQEEPIELPTLSGAISVQGSRVLYDEHDISLTADGQGALTYSLTPRIQFRGFLFFDPDLGIQYDQNVTFDNKASWDLSFTGSLTGNVDIPLKGLPEKNIKMMKIAVNCGLFLNTSITGLTVGATWESEYTGRDYLVYSNHDFTGLIGNQSTVLPAHKHNITFTKDTITYTVSTQGKYTFSAGVYAKAEASLKLPFHKKEIKTKFGARLEAGARLSFEAPVWTADVMTSLLSTTSIYQLLNKETNISASIYGKFSAYCQFNDWLWALNPPEGTLAKSYLWGLVPDITGINASYDDIERLYRIKFTSPIRRDVLFGIQTGFTFFDQDKKQIDDWDGGFHFRESQGTSYSHVFTTLDPIKDEEKTYTAYPYIKYLGYPILVDKSVDVTVDPARIDIEQREVFVGRDGGSLDISVKPNMANVECTSNEKWLSFVWLDHKNELAIYWDEMPKDTNDRKATILLQGKNSKTGELIIEDSVVVVQHEDLLEFTPKSIEAEANGGTFTVNITKTNLKNLSVSTESDFCKATLKDNVITVTVSENTTAEERFAAITIKGKNVVDKEVSDDIRISQAAGTSPGGDTRTITQKAFCGKWRKLDDINYTIATLIINEDLSYEQKEVCIEDYNNGARSYKKGDVINNRRMFGKFEFWDPDNWTVLSKEYMQQTDLKEYDKGYFVGYKQIERKVADRKYGKWLSDDNSVTMMGYFEISSDYKYMIENNRYLWVKMDENDPYYPEPYMNYKDPAYLDLIDSVSYVSNIRPEPERMRYVNFGINEDEKFLTDIQVTPVESFLHVDSIKNRTVYYSFDENTSLKKREGHFNVQGTWPDGSIGKAVFTVRQNGGRTLENLSKIYFSGSSKAIKTIVKKHNKDGDTTDTDENSRFGVSLTATSFTVNAAGSGLKIEASDEQNAKNVTFTLSEGFKKRSKANDIVYIQDYTKKIADGTDVLKGSMKASNVPCYNDSGDKMTIRGELSDGVTISDASYMKYWEAENPEKVSGLWYSSESYEYVNDSGNRVEIEITWNIDKWQR